MTAPSVLLHREGAVARLTLNRPEVGNALDISIVGPLRELATQVATDPSVRCVVLTGAGRLFCTGGDVVKFAAAGERRPAMLAALASELNEALLALAGMRKPLLTVVNGPAAGAGLSLAILGDVVLAARSAHFTAAYGSVGLTPDGGMSWLLPRLIGLRRAQEIILTNRRVTADEAERLGLVTRTVDDAALAGEVAALQQRLATAATSAFGGARQLLLTSFETGLATHLAAEARSISGAGGHPESEEGLRAFVERRRPEFPTT